MNVESVSFAGEWRYPGLRQLVAALRAAGFPIGTSEAIDAARLLRRLAEVDPGAGEPTALRSKLRPVFCKSREDQARFDSIFTEWAGTLEQRWSQATPEASSESRFPAPIPTRWTSQRLRIAIAFLATLAIGVAGYYYYLQSTKPEANEGMPATTAPSKRAEPAPEPPKDAVDTERFSGYFPSIRYNQELRAAWAWGTLALPLFLLLVFTLPGFIISRTRARRRGGVIRLDRSSLEKEAERLVPPIEADVTNHLERHIRGAASLHHRFSRRPPLDLRRTVEATIRDFGVPRLRFRHAHLRPSYLVLIDAESEDDPRGRLFYLWADRLRREGLEMDLRLFRAGGSEEAPLCFRSQRSGWRDAGREGQRLDRLEDPPFGQRLVVVSNGHSLVGEDAAWRQWARRARFYRWRDRVLFTPVEPRDWGPREEAIERSERTADPGFLVLPLDEGALRAWADLLTTGQLPEIVLSELQRYPRLIQQLDETALLDDDTPVNELGSLISQLKLYLGENGFYWLAACAVPPIIRWELTLLLGEHLLRRSGATDERFPHHLSRNYRRLARLPWIRKGHMPDWLRLGLLAQLPRSVQDEVRAAVRGLLDPLRPAAGGLDLAFEAPPGGIAANDGRGKGKPSGDTLYLGYMSGLTPRQLALRAPPSWSRWLPKLRLDGFARAHWRERLGWARDWLGALWARLAYRHGLPFSGGVRWTWVLAAALLALWLTVLAGVYFSNPDNWPKPLGDLLFEEQVHALVFRHQTPVLSVAFISDGRRVMTTSDDGTARLWDAETGAALGATLQHKGPVNHAAFSPDERWVVTASDDGTARLWDAETGAALGATLQHIWSGGKSYNFWTGAALGATLQHEGAVTQAVFSPDGRRVVTASDDGTARLWDGKSAPAPPIAPPEIERGPRWLDRARDALVRWVAAGVGLLALAAMAVPGVRLRRRVARYGLGTASGRV